MPSVKCDYCAADAEWILRKPFSANESAYCSKDLIKKVRGIARVLRKKEAP